MYLLNFLKAHELSLLNTLTIPHPPPPQSLGKFLTIQKCITYQSMVLAPSSPDCPTPYPTPNQNVLYMPTVTLFSIHPANKLQHHKPKALDEIVHFN